MSMCIYCGNNFALEDVAIDSGDGYLHTWCAVKDLQDYPTTDKGRVQGETAKDGRPAGTEREIPGSARHGLGVNFEEIERLLIRYPADGSMWQVPALIASLRELEAQIAALRADNEQKAGHAAALELGWNALEADVTKLRADVERKDAALQWAHDRLGNEQKFGKKYPADRWMVECSERDAGKVIKVVRERLRTALTPSAGAEVHPDTARLAICMECGQLIEAQKTKEHFDTEHRNEHGPQFENGHAVIVKLPEFAERALLNMARCANHAAIAAARKPATAGEEQSDG